MPALADMTTMNDARKDESHHSHPTAPRRPRAGAWRHTRGPRRSRDTRRQGRGFGRQQCTDPHPPDQNRRAGAQSTVSAKSKQNRSVSGTPVERARQAPSSTRPQYACYGSNRIRHLIPAGTAPSGFGRSRRTPNVPLAASMTGSTMVTAALCRPPTGSIGAISAVLPAWSCP